MGIVLEVTAPSPVAAADWETDLKDPIPFHP